METIELFGVPVDVKEFREKWYADLTSGEYEQVRKSLHHSGGYCCLGVAACTLAKMGLPLKWDENILLHPSDCNGIDSSVSMLNFLTATSSELLGANQDSLAGLNDRGKTFGEIAEHLKSLWDKEKK